MNPKALNMNPETTRSPEKVLTIHQRVSEDWSVLSAFLATRAFGDGLHWSLSPGVPVLSGCSQHAGEGVALGLHGSHPNSLAGLKVSKTGAGFSFLRT